MDVEITITTDTDRRMIHVMLSKPVGEDIGLTDIPTCHEGLAFGGTWSYDLHLAPVVSLSLRDQIAMAKRLGYTVTYGSDADKAALKASVAENIKPSLSWDDHAHRVIAVFPQTERYKKIIRSLYGSPRADASWSFPITSLNDCMACNERLPKSMRFSVSDDVQKLLDETLPDPYDGTAESLRLIPVSALRVVQSNIQSFALRKIDPASIAEKLERMDVHSLYDLLMIRPRRYIDRSNPQDIRDLIEGETVTVVGRVTEWKEPSSHLSVMVVEDKRGASIQCSFFNQSRWFKDHYKVNDEVIVTGAYKPWKSWSGYTVDQIAQPQVDPIEAAGAVPIMPVYHTPAKAALSSMILVHCEQELVSRLGPDFRGPSWADPALQANDISGASYGQALKIMHFPKTTDSQDDAEQALAFCEMVQLLVWIEAHRSGDDSTLGVDNTNDGSYQQAYESCLPYALTGAQHRSITTITSGMSSQKNLHALLVGDVGSGKTTVMHMAALNAVNAGHQAVICAPTEILATQLYDVFMRILASMPSSIADAIHPILHAGYTGKGSAKRRRDHVSAVADGQANMIFGTQGVLNLDYADLSFVGVDEQHKFGAAQRSRLLDVRDDGHVPDFLMQTATPIPRSMAQVYYGDVTYLALDELPAGRQPITTEWVKKKGSQVVADPASPIWADVLSEIRAGHGVFIVCPMVSESEKTDAASVRRTVKELADVFPDDVQMTAVYGGQDKKKQEAAITGFKDGSISVLVASSVVEVGVSCELATRMIILDANRFGIASLHQIRGRIGRSNLPSKCWLVAMPFNDTGSSRMQAMCNTLDGWKLSKTDLRNRGTGSIFGTAQSGKSDLMYANLVRDAAWIAPARQTAKTILRSDHAQDAIDDARKYFCVDEDQGILS